MKHYNLGQIMKKLPIGISSLEKLIKENCYYVDKTYFVEKLANSGNQFFLSRPRRFGKSLLVDTIKQAFLGNMELFKGLYLENNWDWEKKYPVIHIDFGGGVVQDAQDLKEWIIKQLKRHIEIYTLDIEPEKHDGFLFERLIKTLYKKYGTEVVVLIDDCDKPIFENLENREKALEIKSVLVNLYLVLKSSSAYIKFALLTGETNLPLATSIFSGLNHLINITLDPKFATICGYTQSELETVFADRLEGVELEKLRYWYNGYSWLGDKVYNPFDVLLFLSEKIFRPYWFETGTPTFLMEIILNNKVFLPKLEEIKG